MRFFAGLVLALALGVMGCSETSGTGGSAGDGGVGGVGGDGGNGGGGGGLVTDCAGEIAYMRCTIEGVEGFCCSDACFVFDCEAFEDGTECYGGPKPGGPGLCEAGECRLTPKDCTGLEDGTECWDIPDGPGLCEGGECRPMPDDCTGLENGTRCRPGELACKAGECEAGECVTE